MNSSNPDDSINKVTTQNHTNTCPLDIKWHLAWEHSHLSSALLDVRDGNSRSPLHSTRSPASQAHFQPHRRGTLRNLWFQDLRLRSLKAGDKQRQMQLIYAHGEIRDRKAEIPRWCLLTQTCSCRIKAVRQEGESRAIYPVPHRQITCSLW